MILIITSSPRAQECLMALEKACGVQVQVANSARAAMTELRRNEFSAVIIDQNLIDPDPLAQETLLRHVGTAIPVYVNFALSSVDRVVRDVEVALRRSEQEHLRAMRVASSALRNDLKGALTGILLTSELALGLPELPSAAEVKIRFVYELAQTMRRQLETTA